MLAQGRKGREFYSRWGGSPDSHHLQESWYGRRVVVSCGDAAGQWHPQRVDAGVCGSTAWHRPMARRTSYSLGTQCPQRPASDRWS
jgi:hypothetical protein